MSDKYIYLFIRKDLSRAQQIIQTAHSVDQLDYPGMGETDDISNMVLFEIDSERELYEIANKLQEN